MKPISRRGFVGIGAGLVAGAALPAVTPATAAAAAATGTITDVKHVVILMQENRSRHPEPQGGEGLREG
ncbi:hypothetical protein, partial [Streptomyces sp. NPDC056491]|uniref:hypothetical protein n=1 Tax=Streptomyces sp. NPDC056491 TaxID=3345837 RepID=UPI003673B802